MTRARRLALVVVATMAIAVPLRAETTSERAIFTVSVAGITAGRLTLAANVSGTEYAVTSRATSAGLAGLFSSFVLESRVVGRLRGGTFQPDRYAASGEGDRAGRGAEIRYKGGIPTVVSAAREPDSEAPVIDPATMGGTVDPQTAMYAVLRDVPGADLCNLALDLFDGHRHSRVRLRPGSGDDGAPQCDGLYRRIGGYSPAELADRRDTAFTVAYDGLPGGRFRVREIAFSSSFGKARLTRD